MAPRMIFVINHAGDFRDDVAATLDFNPVSDFHAQTLDLVHVVQCGTTDGGAADGHRLEFCDGREFPGPPDLNVDIFDLRDSAASGVFVGNRPARGFAGESQLALQGCAVDFDYNA